MAIGAPLYVYVPTLTGIGRGVSPEESFSRNYEKFDDAGNAISTLERRVIAPFRGAALKEAFPGLVDNDTGDISDGLEETLRESIEVEGNYRVKATIFPKSNPKYKQILNDFVRFLHDRKEDNEHDVRVPGVRRLDGKVYLRIDYALDKLQSIHDENSIPKPGGLVYLINKETGEQPDYEEAAKHIWKLSKGKKSPSMTLDEIDFGKAGVSPSSISRYNRAMTIRLMLRQFRNSYYAYAKRFDRVPKDLSGQKIELHDYMPEGGTPEGGGSNQILRFLYHTQRRIGYDEAYHLIAGMKTEKISRTTGDLSAISELEEDLFDDDYAYNNSRRKSKVSIRTRPEKDGNARVIIIERKEDGTSSEYRYFHDRYGSLYINADDIISAINGLIESHTENQIWVKPSLLRRKGAP